MDNILYMFWFLLPARLVKSNLRRISKMSPLLRTGDVIVIAYSMSISNLSKMEIKLVSLLAAVTEVGPLECNCGSRSRIVDMQEYLRKKL